MTTDAISYRHRRLAILESQRAPQSRVCALLVVDLRCAQSSRSCLSELVYEREAPDRSSNVPTSNVLARLTRQRDLIGDTWPGLFSVARLLPQAERATWSGPGFPDAMFDFILVSEGLRDRIDGVWVDRNDTLRVSDHQPLVVKFRVW